MDRRLVILGIPWDVDTEELTDYMHKFGEIEDCIVMKERSTGRYRGYGYVLFTMEKDAKASDFPVVMNSFRHIDTVDGHDSVFPAPFTADCFVYIAYSHFEEFREITDLYMPKDRATEAHRGIGFIAFPSSDSVDNLMNETHELGGSAVVVDQATSKEDDFRTLSRVPQGGYGANNAYISAATRYDALGAPTLYDHPGSFYGRGDHDSIHDMCRKIFVGRLPQEATADDLRHYFGRFGWILDAYVPKDPKRSGQRGFGLVTFVDDGVVERVSRGSHEICGQQIPSARESATPLDDAGSGSSHVMSNPVLEPFMDYLGPMRSYSRMHTNLDYPDWGYGLGGGRRSRADIRY